LNNRLASLLSTCVWSGCFYCSYIFLLLLTVFCFLSYIIINSNELTMDRLQIFVCMSMCVCVPFQSRSYNCFQFSESTIDRFYFFCLLLKIRTIIEVSTVRFWKGPVRVMIMWNKNSGVCVSLTRRSIQFDLVGYVCVLSCSIIHGVRHKFL